MNPHTLGTQTHVPMITEQPLYQLNCIPSPQILLKSSGVGGGQGVLAARIIREQIGAVASPSPSLRQGLYHAAFSKLAGPQAPKPVELWVLNSKDHQKTQIFTLQFITVAKLQL